MVGPTCRVPFLNSLVVSQRKRPYGQSDHVRSVRCELKYESWWPVADDVLGRLRSESEWLTYWSIGAKHLHSKC